MVQVPASASGLLGRWALLRLLQVVAQSLKLPVLPCPACASSWLCPEAAAQSLCWAEAAAQLAEQLLHHLLLELLQSAQAPSPLASASGLASPALEQLWLLRTREAIVIWWDESAISTASVLLTTKLSVPWHVGLTRSFPETETGASVRLVRLVMRQLDTACFPRLGQLTLPSFLAVSLGPPITLGAEKHAVSEVCL